MWPLHIYCKGLCNQIIYGPPSYSTTSTRVLYTVLVSHLTQTVMCRMLQWYQVQRSPSKLAECGHAWWCRSGCTDTTLDMVFCIQCWGDSNGTWPSGMYYSLVWYDHGSCLGHLPIAIVLCQFAHLKSWPPKSLMIQKWVWGCQWNQQCHGRCRLSIGCRCLWNESLCWNGLVPGGVHLLLWALGLGAPLWFLVAYGCDG